MILGEDARWTCHCGVRGIGLTDLTVHQTQPGHSPMTDSPELARILP